MKSGIRWVFILLFLFEYISLSAQEVDNQFWVNYALSIRPNTSWSYGGDAGFRGFVSNEEWNQLLVRPTASYRFNQVFGVSGAVAWFSTFNDGEDNDINEFRIHQDFNVNWPDLNILRLFYRLRIEQRWFYYKSDQIDDDFKVRTRYLIGAESADVDIFNNDRPFYLQVILEGFKTLADDNAAEIFINRTRTHLAIGQRISDKFRWEFHYINQQSRRISDFGLETTENIFRIRTFHRIRHKPKEEEEVIDNFE